MRGAPRARGWTPFFALVALWPATALGQASALGAPGSEGASPEQVPEHTSAEVADAAGVEAREGTEVHLSSEVYGDTARARPADDASAEPLRCDVPCHLDLSPGRWHLRFASGVETDLEVAVTTLLVKARPMDGVELGIGIGAIVAGLVALGFVAATAEDMCWSLDGSCSLDYGPLVLGVGGMAIAVGIGLSIDSAASVDVTALPGLRPREE